MEIIFRYDSSDNEFASMLRKTFKDNVDFIEVQKFDGNTVFEAIAFISSVITIGDFIYKHMTLKSQNTRVIVTKGKEITFENYSKDEVVDMIDSISKNELL